MQTPNAHLRGAGCPLCGREKTIKGKTWTTERFIKAARLVHGDAYDYSKTVYVKTSQKVCIICKRCGREFWQTPNSHLAGHGCEVCSYVDRGANCAKSQDEFLRQARDRWGNRFDLSQVEYKCSSEKVCVICKEHGPFYIRPYQFLNGGACPICKSEKAKKIKFGRGVNDLPCESQTPWGKIWNGMFNRCYRECDLKKHPSYRGVEICEEWWKLSEFKKWFLENYIEGYELDKDIIHPGSRVYSPENCCFVPRRINILLTNRARLRGMYPVGVTYRKNSGKFAASIDKDGMREFLGSFNTPKEAFSAYKKAKESYIKEVAQEYFDKGLITERVKDALFCYKVEITD